MKASLFPSMELEILSTWSTMAHFIVTLYELFGLLLIKLSKLTLMARHFSMTMIIASQGHCNYEIEQQFVYSISRNFYLHNSIETESLFVVNIWKSFVENFVFPDRPPSTSSIVSTNSTFIYRENACGRTDGWVLKIDLSISPKIDSSPISDSREEAENKSYEKEEEEFVINLKTFSILIT